MGWCRHEMGVGKGGCPGFDFGVSRPESQWPTCWGSLDQVSVFRKDNFQVQQSLTTHLLTKREFPVSGLFPIWDSMLRREKTTSWNCLLLQLLKKHLPDASTRQGGTAQFHGPLTLTTWHLSTPTSPLSSRKTSAASIWSSHIPPGEGIPLPPVRRGKGLGTGVMTNTEEFSEREAVCYLRKHNYFLNYYIPGSPF